MTNRRLRRGLRAVPAALVLTLPLAVAAPATAGNVPDRSARAATAACPAAAADPTVASPRKLERTVLCLVNRERSSRGLRRLRLNLRLNRAARRHSTDMVRRNFFSHVSPGGSTLMQRAKRAGYRSGGGSLLVGENLAWGSGSYARPIEIVDGWLNSPGHRMNMLHPRFREIGVGVAFGAPRPVGGSPAATYANVFGARG